MNASGAFLEEDVIRSAAKDLGHQQATRVNDLLVVPAFVDTLRAEGLDSLDALFNLKNAESLSKPGLQSWRQRLRFEMQHGGQSRVFYMKRFIHPPSAGRREVRQAGNGARSVAGIEWNWMRALAADGIPCTRPVAFGDQFRRGRETRSAVVMEAVPGHSLEKWAASLPFSLGGPEGEGHLPPSPHGRGVRGEGSGTRNDHPIESMLHELAHLVACFHARGCVHRDLYLAHIFYDPSAAKGTSLRLIDLQRVFRPNLWPSRWIVKDLAALNYSTPQHVLSRAGRLRWLREYLEEFSRNTDSRGDAAFNDQAHRFDPPRSPLSKGEETLHPVIKRASQSSEGRDIGATAYLKRLAIRIAGKTSEIARHDQKRKAR